MGKPYYTPPTDVAELQRQLLEQHETNQRLNRRCQAAEKEANDWRWRVQALCGQLDNEAHMIKYQAHRLRSLYQHQWYGIRDFYQKPIMEHLPKPPGNLDGPVQRAKYARQLIDRKWLSIITDYIKGLV